MEIKPLDKLSFHKLYAVRNEAFKDYVRQWTKEEFQAMLHRRGYVPELSFGAFDNDDLVSFTLNGTGDWAGQKTAYDTGTGTIPAYRGKGLATSIFNASVPFLKQAGVTQYLLEVLQDNTKAISVYTNIGFTIARSFNYFVQDVANLKLPAVIPASYQLRTINTPDINEVSAFWDFMPSWQNSHDAIMRKSENFVIVGAYDGNKLVGYGIIEPTSGDIPQLAVNKGYRRQGIGSAILKELLQHNQSSAIKVINTDAAYEPMTAFLQSNGIPQSGAQFEMIKQLG
ncbi:MAG: family N-acetyltransferase [Flavipsychrobacter sp.]|jgi:ribosomal protein S18 acetylase RimI-like enzyme|nr:family N-acetyltransferase [Flavipsychrobacter sp.]